MPGLRVGSLAADRCCIRYRWQNRDHSFAFPRSEVRLHLCHSTLPTADTRSALFRSIRKNGNLSQTALSGAAVHAAIRRRAGRAGYDADLLAQLGGHSLRAGFVTQAFRNGADAHAIMRQTGHRSPGMVEIYARENAPLVGNAVNDLGL